jgi:hypothetical protein
VVAVRVAILAQDLIWSDRLARAVQAAGGVPVPSATGSGFDRALVDCPLAVVDLTAHAYDAMAAIERARTAGARVLAVGQHDDLDLRKQALARGAERVFAYRKLFEAGPATIGAWIERARPVEIAP